MKIFTLLFAALLLSGTIIAQHDHAHFGPENPVFCANNLERDRAFEANPALRVQDSIDQANFQSFYEDYYANHHDPSSRSTYVVPVVVHVVHLGGVDNISDEQIFDAIEKLNEDFSATNSDLGNTVSPHDGIIGNGDIEFRLATRDPQGNCHSGITRTFSENTNHDGGNGILQDIQAEHGNWPQNKYMNVIVCQDPAGAAGYTNNPGNWYNASGMGGSIYMRHDYMGTIGTGSNTARHTLSHEVGHWLNLSHCWGGNNNPGQASACNDDDGVDDTPRTIGWTSCNVNGNTCSNDAVDGYWGTDVIDNVQNIMEYSYCSTMFSDGQVARMHAALNSNTADRDNLWTPSNLAATGVDGPGDLCEVIFSSDLTVICAGSSVQFTDNSYHNVTTTNWTFEGGTPGTSSDSEPVVTYNTPGVYDVTLQASDGSTMLTNSESNYIVVMASPGEAPPYSEGFETLTGIPDNQRFVILNENNGETWEHNTGVGYEGDKCAWVNNYYGQAGDVDEIMSGTIDLSGVDPADDIVFNFKYAYRKRTGGEDEWLKFYISNDCGETWVLRKNIHGDNLGTVTASNNYVPAGPEDWVNVDITNINSGYYVENFRFKFTFESDGGNNIYIDNINLYPESMSNIVEEDQLPGISVYPNPTTDMTTLEFFANANQDYNVTIYNAIGQKVMDVHQGPLNAGMNTLNFSTGTLPEGVYYIRVESEGRIETIKLIKQ